MSSVWWDPAGVPGHTPTGGLCGIAISRSKHAFAKEVEFYRSMYMSIQIILRCRRYCREDSYNEEYVAMRAMVSSGHLPGDARVERTRPTKSLLGTNVCMLAMALVVLLVGLLLSSIMGDAQANKTH